MHRLDAVRYALDTIPYPVLLGCVAIGLGTALIGVTSIVRSLSDRARHSRSTTASKRIRKLEIAFIFLLLCGGLLTCFGTWLTINGGKLSSERAFVDMKRKSESDSAEIKRAMAQIDTKIANALRQPPAESAAQLQQAKTEFDEWADKFWSSRADLAKDIKIENLDERSKPMAMSLKCRATIEKSLKIIEKAAAAYNQKASTKAEIAFDNLPENICGEVNVNVGTVSFAVRAAWKIDVFTPRPIGEEVQLRVVLYRLGAEKTTDTGGIFVHLAPSTHQFWIDNYAYGLPRRPVIADGKQSLDDFDTIFRDAIFEVFASQALLFE